ADIGDKISEDEKSGIQSEVDKLKEMLKADSFDVEAVKTQTEAVSKKFYEVSEKLYAATKQQQDAQGAQDAQGEPNPNQGNNTNADDNVVDADFTEVDE
ncbi:MAG: molecular chaperone DnaK, partial [Oscillospiraceae bacterium]